MSIRRIAITYGIVTGSLFANTVFSSLIADEEPPRMEMTTEVPPGITTPDEVVTRLGTLNFFDGVPDKESKEKVYNFLDFQHAFQCYRQPGCIIG